MVIAGYKWDYTFYKTDYKNIAGYKWDYTFYKTDYKKMLAGYFYGIIHSINGC